MFRDQSEARTPQQLRASLPVAGFGGQGLLLLGGHVECMVPHPVVIAKFIIILGNELDTVVTEGNASASIGDRVTGQHGPQNSPGCH